MVEAGELLEWAEVFGNLYGTPRAPVEASLAAGRDVLFDIDWQGTQQLREKARGDMASIFVLPPSMPELERRLRSRALDDERVIKGRMAKAGDELSHWAGIRLRRPQRRHRPRLCGGASDPLGRAAQARAADRALGAGARPAGAGVIGFSGDWGTCPGRSASRPLQSRFEGHSIRGALQTRDRSDVWRSRICSAPRARSRSCCDAGDFRALVLHRVRDTVGVAPVSQYLLRTMCLISARCAAVGALMTRSIAASEAAGSR